MFLDRDGIINENYGYVHSIDKFSFVEGVFDLVARAKQLQYKVIVVTNQSGIGRGYYTEECFFKLNEWMLNYFTQKKADIDKVYFCPHHPSEAIGSYKKVCNCRKPSPGMALRAQKEFALDLKQSIMVGDKPSDIAFAVNAKIAYAFLLGQSVSKLPTIQSQTNIEKIRSLDEVTFFK